MPPFFTRPSDPGRIFWPHGLLVAFSLMVVFCVIELPPTSLYVSLATPPFTAPLSVSVSLPLSLLVTTMLMLPLPDAPLYEPPLVCENPSLN
ncbi:MAG TPA: hypothetical protein VF278_11345 [Pirellulales bacterium]